VLNDMPAEGHFEVGKGDGGRDPVPSAEFSAFRGGGRSSHSSSSSDKAGSARTVSAIRRLAGRLGSHSLIRNVAVAVGGTVAAQGITFAFTPFITRLYGPEAFGIMSVFLAAVSFVAPVANLSYNEAIVLPPSDEEARALLYLSALVGLFVTIVSAIALAVWHEEIAHAIGFTADPSLLWLGPLMIMFGGLVQPLTHWLYRKKLFGEISRIYVIEAMANGMSKVTVGLLAPTAAALVLAGAAINALRIMLLWRSAQSTLMGRDATAGSNHNPVTIESLTKVARNFLDFPLFRAPNEWVRAISYHAPSLVLSALLGPAAAGSYFIASNVIALPISVVAGATGTVFLPHIAEASHRSEKIRPIFLKATVGLALAGLVPFGIVITAGPLLFSFVFGAEWEQAGHYARWLAVSAYFAFAAVPSRNTIPLLGLQGHYLVWEIIAFILRMAALATGAFVLHSDIAAISLFSITFALTNLAQIVWCALSCDTRIRERV
jgi:O-antigen/teichoic acid export membrane protein